MKLYRDQAVVLRTHKLGEADRIITLLTKNNGLVRAVGKGVRRTSSKFGARLEPFNVVDVQLHRGKSLDVITQVESLAVFSGALGADYSRFTVASLMMETAQRLTAESQASPQYYLLTMRALRALQDHDRHPTLILSSYLLRALALGGWAPSCWDCAQCAKPGPHGHFNIAAGGAVCADCFAPGSLRIEPGVMCLLAALLTGDWLTANQADPFQVQAAQGVVNAYTQWHVEYRLKSLPLLEIA